MKKTILFIICVILAVSMTACGNNLENQQVDKQTNSSSISTEDDNKNVNSKEDISSSQGNVQIQNPFTAYESIEKAEQAVGFLFDIPDEPPKWTEEIVVQTMGTEMIEIIYSGENNKLSIRKGIGDKDISGDFNDYEKTEEVVINGIKTTLKGNGDKFNVVTWVNDEYSYAVTSSEGMTEENVTNLVTEIE